MLSYGPDRVDLYRRAATYVDRILRGAKPGDLPVRFPVKYDMAVNLKTAKALGLTVPNRARDSRLACAQKSSFSARGTSASLSA